MKRLNKKKAEELAIKVCGTKKGLTETNEGEIIHSFQLIVGSIRIDIYEELGDRGFVAGKDCYSKYLRVDVLFKGHHSSSWYNIDTLEYDFDLTEKYKRVLREEIVDEIKEQYGIK